MGPAALARLIQAEARRLDDELSQRGGQLSEEQRAAIMLACGDRPLVIIEGQAGTGKSTTLTGIARAHQAAGLDILITSTAALAAERLSHDLHDAGVHCDAYSTQALDHAVTSGRVTLGPDSMIIHDEAALASTSEPAPGERFLIGAGLVSGVGTAIDWENGARDTIHSVLWRDQPQR